MRNSRLILVCGFAALCFAVASGVLWVHAYADRELPQEKHAPRLDAAPLVHDDAAGHEEHGEHGEETAEPCCPEDGGESHHGQAAEHADEGHAMAVQVEAPL